jgi:hypothetical protein
MAHKRDIWNENADNDKEDERRAPSWDFVRSQTEIGICFVCFYCFGGEEQEDPYAGELWLARIPFGNRENGV